MCVLGVCAAKTRRTRAWYAVRDLATRGKASATLATADHQHTTPTNIPTVSNRANVLEIRCSLDKRILGLYYTD